ncbi:MAG: hypothetical protein GX326_05790 [Clostridiaceae bacterium]|nr:hypothetical protein [Clostridiaceae bacterium]
MRKILRKFPKLLLIYVIYLFIAGILIFLKDFKADTYLPQDTYKSYLKETEGVDRAAIIEDREFALTTRFRLLDEAQDSVKILNYGIYKGEVSELFYGKILQAANRGVDVKIVFDGFVNNLKGPINKTKWALVNHPNIEIRFYEKLNLLRPWAFHNRLHDKIWLIDETFILSGGRNIDDRFYLAAEQLFEPIVFDRDFLIYNSSQNSSKSVISDFQNYFEEIWQHDYTAKAKPTLLKNLGKDRNEELIAYVEQVESDDNVSWTAPIDWAKITSPTNKVSLVTNPIQRYKKTPIVLETLSQFFDEAEHTIIAQSPYFVLNEELEQYINNEELTADFHLLTNSYSSSPNILAMLGTHKYQKEIKELSSQIYTYEAEGSIHAKSYVIDDRISMVGSFNLDPRSAFLSAENLIIIDSPELNQSLTEHIVTLMEQSSIHLNEESLSSNNVKPKEIPRHQKLIYSFLYILAYPYDELL